VNLATRRTTTSSSCVLRRGPARGQQHQGLLRFAIASAGNDHRLGANEAPPPSSRCSSAMLTDIFQQIEKAGSAR
jgi:glutamine synthetase type III